MKILNHLEETAANALQELRRLVMELSPSPLEDRSLEEALTLHCDLFARRTQVELNLELDYNGALQPDQEMAVYRITQEALANIQKHAEAGRVAVSLQSKDGATCLSITDNGKGFEPQTAKKGHGLTNMADRARQSGGRLEIKSAPLQGTTVILRFSKDDHHVTG
jgi:signal transduction histidine kinase